MFGEFSFSNKEFVITNPQTPTPWMNYLSNSEYCVLMSNTGGGYSFHIDPKDRRLTRYRYNNIPMDRPGKYIYLKDVEKNLVWSPTWQPVQTTLDMYECHVGLGYNIIKSRYNEIDSTLKYYVPSRENVEIWHVTLKNTSAQPKTINLFSYVEFALWKAINDQWDLQYIQNVAVANFENNLIFYSLFDFSPKAYVFFTCSDKIISFDCDRDAFIGPYRSETNPIAVEKNVCSNSLALGGNPIAGTSMVVSLLPGESKTLTFMLGIAKTKDEAFNLAKKFSSEDVVVKELQNVKNSWNKLLSNYETKTPDKNFDNLVNVFTSYQCFTTFNWSRYVSFYETGIGRGMGFRDCCQDILGVVHTIPNRVRARIIDLLENQFIDGHVYHQFFPLTKTGGFPDYIKEKQLYFSDDHLWIILSVTYYLKETGEFSLLNEQVKFVDGEKTTVYEHLKRSIAFSFSHFGCHNIPLMGSADWNDALQLPGLESESVFSAMLLHCMLLEMISLAKRMDKEEDYNYYIEKANELKNTINTACWDGEWFLRGFTTDSKPVGGKSSLEGILYLNTQTWAILSQVTSPERSSDILSIVKDKLATIFGVKLLDKPYTQFHSDLGGISTFPPGLKENGAIFCHTNPWLVIAECMLGEGDKAFDYFKRYSPLSKISTQEIHKTEPYIFSQMITGPDHPKFGQAKNSWLTGTAAWSYHAMTNWILGIRPDYDGLIIDPCIPKNWKEFSVTRVFRGSTYHISVSNCEKVSKGIKKIIIDNCERETNIIPIFTDFKDHFVEITMGQG